MTINIANNNPRINYTATANQTVFTVPFEFFDNTDIKVYIEGTLKTITTHYTVSGGNGSTGSVTLTAGATLNDEVTLVRDVPLERTTDLTSSYNAASIDAQLDRIVAEIADLDDRVSRTIQINDYELASGLLLPALDSRKGKTIQFNTSSGALEVGPTGADLTAIGSVTSEIATLAGISGNITTVAGSNAAITAVSNSITSVNAINTALTNVNRVGNAIVIVDLVGTSISDVNDVADSLGEISAVQAKLTNIDTVAIASTNIGTVAGSISQVNSVASKIADVTGVNNNISAITTANANSTNINLVANNIDDVNDVGTVITKVTTVADNIANVNLVAPNAQYLSDVANNITAINAIAPLASDLTNVTDNLTAIQNAGTNATNAASSATSAATSATAAQTAKTAAETALDEFTDIYLGSKSVAPTVDNDGNALATGSIYWNSSIDQLYIWDGSAWDDAAFTASGAVTSFNTRTGAVTLSSADVTNAAGLLTTGGTMTGALNVESTITADGLTVDGLGTITKAVEGQLTLAYNSFNSSTYGYHSIVNNNVGNEFSIHTGNSKTINLAANGDISFYEDTGTTAKFFWDSSTESLGIGTSSPSGKLSIEGTTATGENSHITFENTAGAKKFAIGGGKSGVTNNGFAVVNVTDNTAPLFINDSGQVGIGTSSPTINLHVAGGAGGIRYVASSGASTLMYSDTNAGYLGTENNFPVIIQQNNAERMRIDSSGKVLVGGTSQADATSVTLNPEGYIYAKSSHQQAGIFDRDNSDGDILIFRKDGSAVGSIGNSTTNLLIKSTSGSGLFFGSGTIAPMLSGSLTNNSIDIGTSTYGFKDLYLSGGVSLDGSSGNTLYKSGSDLVLNNRANATTIFGTNNTERMRIDSSGNVAIGTNSPASDGKLTIHGTDTDSGILLSRASGNDVAVHNIGGTLAFRTGGESTTLGGLTERMRIDSSGNLLVNTTSLSVVENGGFAVKPDVGNGTRLDISNAAESMIVGRTGSDGQAILFYRGGTGVGSISVTGSSTSYNTSSDYRLKENVVDLTGASARVNQLNPSRFNFISDDTNTTVDGFLAHEVADVVPEAITGTKDAMKDEEYEVTPATGDIYTPATEAYVDDDGNDVDAVDEVIHSADAEQPETLEDGQQWRETTAAVMGTRSVPDYQGIDQSKLVPLLTAALQEALTEIASLKTRVEALEG